ncbi:hypothetical protein AVEN_106642-1 [Araneus ventricosus]|uniref:Uncharacterized protein n=1 Tax=Araneus ventricosus TaxID=182803 RepID=A0A4Y2VHS9_ARAVE|nr:hypothetical protein AVEN_106642-1 [Araneus ventricosus]
MTEAGSNIRAGKERKSFGQNPPHRVIHLVLQDQVGSPSPRQSNLRQISIVLHSNILKGSSPRRKIDSSSVDTLRLFCEDLRQINIHRPLHSNILKGSSPRRKIDSSSVDTLRLFCEDLRQINIHRPLHSNILKGSSPRRKIDSSSVDTLRLFCEDLRQISIVLCTVIS